LTFRVFLALIGTLCFAIAGIGLSREASTLEWWAWSVVAGLVLLGGGLLYASFFCSDRNAEKWSDAASNHEAAALILVLAFPLTWAIRKVFPSDAT
jgi:drug/metabolite transporter (DMT)-like permease